MLTPGAEAIIKAFTNLLDDIDHRQDYYDILISMENIICDEQYDAYNKFTPEELAERKRASNERMREFNKRYAGETEDRLRKLGYIK